MTKESSVIIMMQTEIIITIDIELTLHIVSTLYSKQFGETLQWRLIGIVSPYSEPNAAAKCVHYMESFTVLFED